MTLQLLINGTDFTSKWRLYESRWSTKAWNGEVMQSEFVIDDFDGAIDHDDLSARKIVEVWEDASGSSVCMYHGRVANKTLGMGAEQQEPAMRWTVLVEDYNVELSGIMVHDAERPEETDDERVEAIRIAFLNGAASTHADARQSTELGNTYLGPTPADAITLPPEHYEDTEPGAVLNLIAELSGRNFWVYLNDDGTGELVYMSRSDMTLLSDIELTDDDPTADGIDVFAPYKGPQAGDHAGQGVLTGGAIRYLDGTRYEDHNIGGAAATYDKWEATFQNDYITTDVNAQRFLNKTITGNDEANTYFATIDMRPEDAHRIRAGMMVPLTRVRANKNNDAEARAVTVTHEPVKPNADGESWYRVTMELGRPHNVSPLPKIRRQVPRPPKPTVPPSDGTPDCYDGDDGDHTETIPAFGSQPSFTTAAWNNETTAGYNHPAQYYWRFASSGNYEFFPSATISSGNAGDHALGAASAGDVLRFDFDHRYGGAFASTKTFRFRVQWLSGAYDGTTTGYTVLSNSTYNSPCSSTITSHSLTATAPASTTAYRIIGNTLEPWYMHKLCITAIGGGGTAGDGNPDAFPDDSPSTGTQYAPWPHAHTFRRDRAPGADDDDEAGYHEGDMWVNTETGELWALDDNTDDAAVWLPLAVDETSEDSDAEAFPLAFAVTDVPDGGWQQVDKPIAVYSATSRRTYFAYLRGGDGDACVRYYDHRAGTTSDETVIAAALEVDTHANPGILLLDDGHLLVFYSTHNDANQWFRRSTNAEDISAFGTAYDVDSQLGGTAYTYATIAQLNDVTGAPLFMLIRPVAGGTGQYWSYSLSTDRGVTWAALTQLTATTARTPYMRMTKTSESRIDFIFADGTSGAEDDISVFHFYYDGTAGTFHKTDGTSAGTLPLASPSEMSLVFDGDPGFKARYGNVGLGADGYPRCTFIVTPDAGDVHGYYGRWDGSAWNTTDVTGDLQTSGTDVFGAGFELDPDAPAQVWTSVAGVLTQFVTTDGGATFSSWTISVDTGVDHVLPHVPLNRADELPVLWLSGSTVDDTDWDQGVSGYLTTLSLPTGSGVAIAVAAEDVSIADAGGYYTGTDVEAALQEIGADLATPGTSQHILLADGRSTPFTFDDLLQMDDGSDFMWTDPE